jgi:hypothetical protein
LFSANIAIIEVALRSLFLTPVSETQLSNPVEVHEAIMVSLKSGRLRPQRYPEHDLEKFSPTISISPGQDFQCH